MQTFICFLLIFMLNFLEASPKEGKLIIFAGLSGSGKSTLAKDVAELAKALCFLEPEENEWPDFVRKKQSYGEFSSLMTIRAIRVHSLWKAWAERNGGHLVFVDTYYDKINAYALGKRGMEWLIDPNDPYFSVALQTLQIDNQILPNADLIVLIDISYEDWIKMLHTRNREKDFIEGFQESYALTKAYMSEAIHALSLEQNIPVFFFQQTFDSPKNQALLLYESLKQEGFISP